MKDILERFVSWIKLKIRLHLKDDVDVKKLYFREKEIWWMHLGKNLGHEEDGKNEQYERPVIILRKFNKDFFWGIPTSTKIKPENRFYDTFVHQEDDYSAIISQMKPISSKRLIRKIGVLGKLEYEKIIEKTLDLIKNDSRINK